MPMNLPELESEFERQDAELDGCGRALERLHAIDLPPSFFEEFEEACVPSMPETKRSPSFPPHTGVRA
jgi:hypothetical protein